MPRRSIKKDKNMYFMSREKAGLTREAASELLEFMSEDRIDRIETEKSLPHPDEVLAMAKAYGDLLLINKYCTEECPIGQRYAPKVTSEELTGIVLQIMDCVNGLSDSKDRLISIAADGIIDENERPEFEKICTHLDRISTAATTLKFWMEEKLG